MTSPNQLLPAVEVAVDFVISAMETLQPKSDEPTHLDELASSLIHLSKALKSTMSCYRRALNARSQRTR
jgi:hypothetical protein